MLPLPTRTVRPLVGARLTGQSGIGAVLAAAMTQTARGIGSFRPADALRISTNLLDLLGTLLAHELELDHTDDVLAPHSHQRALLCQIHAYIQQHLHGPTLSPASIAAAHHISPRTLHALFQTQELTVAAWIRARRLDRCRHDLANPSLANRAVHTIAERWGFTNSAHFSRLFKAAFGLGPHAYRQTIQPRP
jgi:AraC-like DNA-binding protein